MRAIVVAVLLVPAVAAAQAPPDRARAVPAEARDTGARMTALLELGRARDRNALPVLVAALVDPNRDVRWAAVEALGDLGDRRAVPALVQYLAARRKEAYRWGRRLVANALGAIGGAEANEALTALLADPDPFVRRSAAISLLRQGDPLLLARLEPVLRESPDDHLTTVKREFARVRDGGPRRGTGGGAALVAAPPPVRAREWASLKVGASRIDDATERLGAPLQRTADSLLFRGDAAPTPLKTESIVVNGSSDGVIESILVFPVWGTLDRDVRAVLGHGRILTYGEFLRVSGRTAFGAGTRADGKLHYLPADLLAESFTDLGVLVVYDSADVAARDRLVKLLIVY